MYQFFDKLSTDRVFIYRTIFIFLLICIIVTFLFVKATNKPVKLYAKSAVVMNLETHKVLFDKEKDRRLSPGSMTKMLSMLIVFDKLESGELNKNDRIFISSNATGTFASKVGLKTGENILVDDLIKCVFLPSGSDAVIALAEHLYGSEENFVVIMNNKAKELGLLNTHFSNCVGLEDTQHYSTAFDMAMIAEELTSRYTNVYDYTSLFTAQIYHEDGTPLQIYNTNDMLKEDGINGLKTGSTPQSGYNLTMTYNKNNKHIVYVVMNCNTPYFRKQDCLKLLEKY